MTILFIIGRVLLGGYFLYNAWNHFKNSSSLAGYAASKGVPMAKVATIATGILLLLSGVGIVLGLWIRLATLLGIIFFAGVTPMMHQYWKVADPMQRMGERINFMKNLALLGALLMMFAVGL